jgi:acyl-coenzyme A thioesterase PaaI-like protein
VTATATALHRGGTSATYAVSVRDAAGTLICTARMTSLLRDARS